MEDWLELFGKFDTEGDLRFYLPTNDKSLVVSADFTLLSESNGILTIR